MSGIKAKTLQVLDEGGSFIHHTKADQKIEPSLTQLGQRPKDMSHPSDSLGEAPKVRAEAYLEGRAKAKSPRGNYIVPLEYSRNILFKG